jgi:transposase
LGYERSMPQMQLPIFPAGMTEINHQIAVLKEAGTVYYIHGHLPVFRHAENDVRGFRMFTSQMIINGTVKPKEIVQAFGVPMVTVKRYVKVFREQGANGFYAVRPRHSSASVLKGDVLQRAQQLLDEGQSVPEVAGTLKVLANTLHKAIDAGRLRSGQKKAIPPPP